MTAILIFGMQPAKTLHDEVKIAGIARVVTAWQSVWFSAAAAEVHQAGGVSHVCECV